MATQFSHFSLIDSLLSQRHCYILRLNSLIEEISVKNDRVPLFEAFVAIKMEKSSLNILFKYPSMVRKNNVFYIFSKVIKNFFPFYQFAIPNSTEKFCFPDALNKCYHTTKSKTSKSWNHSLVLTCADGSQRYGYCRRISSNLAYLFISSQRSQIYYKVRFVL